MFKFIHIFSIPAKGLVLLFLCLFNTGYSQIKFSDIPANLQFLPRNAQNTGSFTVSGKYTGSVYHSLRSTINDSNVVLENNLIAFDAQGYFSVTHTLSAQLKEYRLKIYLKNDTSEILYKTVSGLVCGDVILITGQSNATAALDLPLAATYDSLYSNSFCRVLGWGADIAVFDSIPISSELEYNRPTCIYWKKGFTGSWGMKLQNDLANETGVPVCMLNGARSGEPITHWFPSHTPSNPDTLDYFLPYDRLFAKLHLSNLKNFAKAIIWYQGEADGALAADTAKKYIHKFTQLYNAFKKDYPKLEHITVVQINTGCGGVNNGIIANQQRQLQGRWPDVSVITTVGSEWQERTPDECHFTAYGYSQLANKILPLLKKYVYGFKLSENDILPPFIVNAISTSANQICLIFDKNITFQNSVITYGQEIFLKNHFYKPNYLPLDITSVISDENKLFLNFTGSQLLPDKITYLPPNYNSISTLYVGPWIYNESSTIGAASFFEFPVIKSNFSIENEIIVHPNPAESFVNVTINNPDPVTSLITLIDTHGKIILQKVTDKTEVNLDIRELSSGVYFLRVSNQSMVTTKKIVVLHKN